LSIYLFRAFIQTSTWSRDSHGLFDFESINVDRKTLNIKNSYFICRKGNIVSTASENCSPTEKKDALIFFKYEGGIYLSDKASIISCCNSDIRDEANDKLWLVLREMQENYYSKVILTRLIALKEETLSNLAE